MANEQYHNPGNLKYNPSIHWQGLADPPQDSRGLCVFIDDNMGCRALSRDLHAKFVFDGLHTWKDIIERYAPPNENDTQTYINHVVEWFGSPNPDLRQLDQLIKGIQCIIRQEQGVEALEIYTIDMITKWCKDTLRIPN